jgi:hypothetical protein
MWARIKMVDVTVAPATHDRKLRDRHAGNRHDHLGTILGNTLLLVLRADDEAGDVVQEDQWCPSLQPRPQTHASPGEAMLRRESQSGHWVAATVRCAALRGMTSPLRRPNALVHTCSCLRVHVWR